MTTTNEGTQCDPLAQIKERVEKATEGPWNAVASFDNLCTAVLAHSGTSRELRVANTFDDADAEFITNARTDTSKLIAALEATLEMASNPGDVVGWSGAPDDLANFAYAIQSAILEALA